MKQAFLQYVETRMNRKHVVSNFLSNWYSSPAKRFLFSAGAIFVVSVFYMEFFGAGFIGSIGVDVFRNDYGIFNLAHFHNFTPIYFALCACIYAIVPADRLNRALVSIHYWASVAAAFVVIYLSEQLIENPPPGWKLDFVDSARLFRLVQGIVLTAQVLFGLNLINALHSFLRQRTKT